MADVIINGTLIEWRRDATERVWEIFVSPAFGYIGEPAARIVIPDLASKDAEIIVTLGEYPEEGVAFKATNEVKV